MRWGTPTPRPGAMREVRRFAWLPTLMDDGTTVWLEHYDCTLVWYPTPGARDAGHWVTRYRNAQPR